MPIYLAEPHTEVTIQRITGTDKIKNHLSNLGFTVGETVIVINKVDENVIVKVRGVSMAISHELASRVIV